MMNLVRRHWYNFGLVVAAIAIAYALLGNLQTVQVILLLFFAALTLHQFEELGWPGGFPWCYNEVVRPMGGPANRYPLNQNNNLFINVWAAYPYVLLPVSFPGAVWLGFGMVLFGVAQFFIHGVGMNLKLKSFYNPGLATVVFGYLPLNAWYVVEVYSHQTVPLWNWAAAAGYLAFFTGVVMLWLGFTVLADKNSPYPFTPEEMERWNRKRHLARLGIT
ncbi:MAG TPA: HXXEE domain-containing protein [Devosia sp.]|nr:HXXEE domain-containing protein [Devosia sp.]